MATINLKHPKTLFVVKFIGQRVTLNNILDAIFGTDGENRVRSSKVDQVAPDKYRATIITPDYPGSDSMITLAASKYGARYTIDKIDEQERPVY